MRLYELGERNLYFEGFFNYNISAYKLIKTGLDYNLCDITELHLVPLGARQNQWGNFITIYSS